MNRAFGESSVFQFTPLHERQHSETELMERAFVFQFTPLHERQHGKKEDGSDDFEFQFTPLHERQRILPYQLVPSSYFNSRLYMRGSSDSRFFKLCSFYFNSRLYMRGSTMPITYSTGKRAFQFTPLHERQHAFDQHMVHRVIISIHAST